MSLKMSKMQCVRKKKWMLEISKIKFSTKHLGFTSVRMNPEHLKNLKAFILVLKENSSEQ